VDAPKHPYRAINCGYLRTDSKLWCCMDSTTTEDVRGFRTKGSRVDCGLYGAVGVRLADGSGGVLCGGLVCVLRKVRIEA